MREVTDTLVVEGDARSRTGINSRWNDASAVG